MKAALVCDALKMALWQRKPKAGLIVHSDQESQYATNAYRRLLKAWKCTGSMSRKGSCWDTDIKIHIQAVCSDSCWDTGLYESKSV